MKLDAERLLSAPLRVASANERNHVLKVQTGRRRSASERQSHLFSVNNFVLRARLGSRRLLIRTLHDESYLRKAFYVNSERKH